MMIRFCRKPALAVSRFALGTALLVFVAAHAQNNNSANPPTGTHSEHTHAAEASSATLPVATRLATDASLRDGMRRLRRAVQALEHVEHGHLDAMQRTNIAVLIDGAVNNMIANCKLNPDADAALHGLLAKFLVGAHAARTGQGVPAALTDMREALKRYPLLFNDPSWEVTAD